MQLKQRSVGWGSNMSISIEEQNSTNKFLFKMGSMLTIGFIVVVALMGNCVAETECLASNLAASECQDVGVIPKI